MSIKLEAAYHEAGHVVMGMVMKSFIWVAAFIALLIMPEKSSAWTGGSGEEGAAQNERK